MIDPIFCSVTAGPVILKVRCHFGKGDDKEAVLRDTKRKAYMAAQKMDSILAVIRSHFSDLGLGTGVELTPECIAMISAREPILYVAVSDRASEVEIHVSLTEEMEYEASELFES